MPEMKTWTANGVMYDLRDASALPMSGGAMTGALNMGGNPLWGLANPTGYDQPVPYQMVLDLLKEKAPSGYGLGGNGQPVSISTLSEIDNIKKNGQYAVTSTSILSIGGAAVQNFILEVSMFTETYGHQIVRLLGGYNTTLRRDCNNGKWSEFDWENPPMFPDVEYRTTERFYRDGVSKPVYTKYLEMGNLINGDLKKDMGISYTKVIRFFCIAHNEGIGAAISFPHNEYGQTAACFMIASEFYIRTNTDVFNGYNANTTIWYTKD